MDDDHGSSDAGVFGKRIRGNDMHPVAAVERIRTYHFRLEVFRHHAVHNASQSSNVSHKERGAPSL